MTTKVVPQLLDQSSGIGYTTGVGATETQQTSKSTAVTLNALCGQITMNGEELASGATAFFTLNNSFIDTTDLVVVNTNFNAAAYRAWVYYTTTGFCNIAVQQDSGGPRSDAVVLNFAIIKSVTA